MVCFLPVKQFIVSNMFVQFDCVQFLFFEIEWSDVKHRKVGV